MQHLEFCLNLALYDHISAGKANPGLKEDMYYKLNTYLYIRVYFLPIFCCMLKQTSVKSKEKAQVACSCTGINCTEYFVCVCSFRLLFLNWAVSVRASLFTLSIMSNISVLSHFPLFHSFPPLSLSRSVYSTLSQDGQLNWC